MTTSPLKKLLEEHNDEYAEEEPRSRGGPLILLLALLALALIVGVLIFFYTQKFNLPSSSASTVNHEIPVIAAPEEPAKATPEPQVDTPAPGPAATANVPPPQPLQQGRKQVYDRILGEEAVDQNRLVPTEEAPLQNAQDCLSLGILDTQTDCGIYETILANLKKMPLAYNKPHRMTKRESTEISLVIDSTGQGKPANELDGLGGKVVLGETKVTRYMSAELKGSSFTVEPTGPQRKIITGLQPVRWTWYATPQVAGINQVLEMSVYAHIQESGQLSDPVPVRTFRDRITVDVAPWDQVAEIAQIVQPVYAGVAALITSGWGLFLWVRNRRWKKRKEEKLVFGPQ